MRDPLIRCFGALLKDLASLNGVWANDVEGAAGFGNLLARGLVVRSCDSRFALEVTFGCLAASLQVAFDQSKHT